MVKFSAAAASHYSPLQRIWNGCEVHPASSYSIGTASFFLGSRVARMRNWLLAPT